MLLSICRLLCVDHKMRLNGSLLLITSITCNTVSFSDVKLEASYKGQNKLDFLIDLESE